MGQALYRKYRSRKLEEIVGQKPIITALSNALKNGQISHAYLFTGPRGVGKTSVARILAYAINQIEYTSDVLPIDVIEIDGASNRGIDEIRDLRDKIAMAPMHAKYKVYIIDEVHMLTAPAFNALLKTLEEPPAHVVFILATTEVHKLPETIISRTQHYSFKLAKTSEVIKHLRKIADAEKINIDDEALGLIATHSGGSLRDAISLLDQIRHSAAKIDAEVIYRDLGLPSVENINDLMTAINHNSPKAVVEKIQQAREDGTSANLIAEQLIQKIRTDILNDKPALPIDQAIHLIDGLLAVINSEQPYIQLELCLIQAQLDNYLEQKPVTSEIQFEVTEPPLTIHEIANRPKNVKTSSQSQLTMDADSWEAILVSIKKSHSTLYGILRMAQPSFNRVKDKQLILNFQFAFHQKRINESKNKLIINDVMSDLGFNNYELICKRLPNNSDDDLPTKKLTNQADNQPIEPENNLIEQIRNIFGSAEVLE